MNVLLQFCSVELVRNLDQSSHENVVLRKVVEEAVNIALRVRDHSTDQVRQVRLGVQNRFDE